MSADLNIDKLNSFIATLSKKAPVARVGILGNGNARSDGKTNAQVGAVHEFGTDKVPQRSFLRQPISEQLSRRLQAGGLYNKQTLENIAAAGSLEPAVKKLAITAEGIVIEAFDSNGFGQWSPLASSTIEEKQRKADAGQVGALQTLVQTQQLRDSITSEVVG